MKRYTEPPLDEISELLIEWEESRSRGETRTADELCRDRPDLRDEVARRIRALEAVYRVANRASSDTDADDLGPLAPGASKPNVPGFEILGVLGRGGMGVVYKARHQRLNRLCALKMLRYDNLAGPMERLRFQVEAEAVAALQHPHIVQLFEVGETSCRPYIVLEYVDGPNLTEHVRGKQIPTTEAVELVEKLADAADYAHRRGIVHRDLKPSNILLSVPSCQLSVVSPDVARKPRTADNRPLATDNWQLTTTPKIADFGLAKRLRENTDATNADLHTKTGAVFGTPAYMAPEQALGRTHDIGPATDVYSLGAIFYELLTGRPPFQAGSVLELLEQVRSQEPLPLRRLSSGIPHDLEIICLKCLAKEPERRYVSAAALADDLRRFQNNEPIQARRVGTWERAVKWAKRRPAVAALFAVVLGLLVIMAIGGTTLAIIATRAADEQKKAKEAALAREREILAVLKFVENKIFAAARPKGQEGGLGRDVALRQAVEAALPFIDSSFANEPLIEARLRMTIATSFRFLGEPKLALAQCQLARTLYAEHLGADHADTLKSVNGVATQYNTLGLYREALPLHLDTLARRKTQLGEDHADTIASMINLASSYAGVGDDAKALQLRGETLALAKATFGDNHPDTFLCMSNLANSHEAVGDQLKSLELRELTLALRKAHPDLGEDHPDTILSMNNLAVSYNAHDRHQEALELRLKTLELATAQLGPDHPDTLNKMHNVAFSYAALKEHDKALDYRLRTLALRRAHPEIGPNHPDTYRSMHSLALTYSDLDQHTDALNLHRETFALREKQFGHDHPETLKSMREIAKCLVDLGQSADAVSTIDDCVQRAMGKPIDPKLLWEVMEIRLRHFETAGDAAGCQATAEMWEKLNRTDAESLFFAARLRAVTAAVFRAESGADATALVHAQSEQAIGWLKKAVAAGYKKTAESAENKDFDILRARDDFQKLVTESVQTGGGGKVP